MYDRGSDIPVNSGFKLDVRSSVLEAPVSVSLVMSGFEGEVIDLSTVTIKTGEGSLNTSLSFNIFVYI